MTLSVTGLAAREVLQIQQRNAQNLAKNDSQTAAPPSGSAASVSAAATSAAAIGVSSSDPSGSSAALSGAALAGSVSLETPSTQQTVESAPPSTAAQQAPEPEVFNAPPLQLPHRATTHDVLSSLARSMADPAVNKTTAQQLYEFHQQLFDQSKSLIQTILDGVRN